jgi:hypothetical protein
MANRANRSEPRKDRPETEEASPPLLSDKLIAQLQSAVSAARSRRMPVATTPLQATLPQNRPVNQTPTSNRTQVSTLKTSKMNEVDTRVARAPGS